MYARVENGEVKEWGNPTSVVVRRPPMTIQVDAATYDNEGRQVFKNGKPVLKSIEHELEGGMFPVSNPDAATLKAAGWLPVEEEHVPHDSQASPVLVRSDVVIRRIFDQQPPSADSIQKRQRFEALRSKKNRTVPEIDELLTLLAEQVAPGGR